MRAAIAGEEQAAESVPQESFDVRGFEVIVENSRPDIATSDVLARLGEALELIERVQPWRMAPTDGRVVPWNIAITAEAGS